MHHMSVAPGLELVLRQTTSQVSREMLSRSVRAAAAADQCKFFWWPEGLIPTISIE
jgi:hypothetical protein